MPNQFKQLGFTLIELIIVIVLLGILAVIGSQALSTAFRAYQTQNNLSEANWSARLILENMPRRIRMIASTSAISTANNTQLSFTDINGNVMNYQLAGNVLQLNGQPLARNISSFTLSYLDQNGYTTSTIANIRYITVSFTISLNNVVYSFRTTTNLRNLS